MKFQRNDQNTKDKISNHEKIIKVNAIPKCDNSFH